MRKSQCHLSRSNLKPSRKISTSLKNSTFPPPRENCLTITETITSNNQTKSQPLPKNPDPKIATLPENFSIPLESFPTLLKFLNPSEKISTRHEIISTPPGKNSISPEKSQPLPKKFQPLPKKSQPLPKNSQPLPKKIQPLSKIFQPPPSKISQPPQKFLNPPPPKISQPPPENSQPPPENFSTPLKISEPHSKKCQTRKIC